MNKIDLAYALKSLEECKLTIEMYRIAKSPDGVDVGLMFHVVGMYGTGS